MEKFVLVFPFNESGNVFLIESGRFPGKYNGVGGVLPSDPDEEGFAKDSAEWTDIYMKRETGIDTSGLEKVLSVIYTGPGWIVYVYRIDIPRETPVGVSENDKRKSIEIVPELVGYQRGDLAPHVPELLSMVLANPEKPFTFRVDR